MPPDSHLDVSSRAASLPAARLDELREWVQVQFGLVFLPAQEVVFRTRVAEVLRTLNVDVVTLQQRLYQGDRASTRAVAEVMSTNYTFFMREAEAFEFLANTFARATGELRVWCAAASSGDEPYSVALVAHETLGVQAGRVHILGTDLSERQLATAEQGIYPLAQLSQLGAVRLQRWFNCVGPGQFQVAPALKGLCTFRRLNLTTTPWPFELKFHVVQLRNVLFYFDDAVRRAVLQQACAATEPGGHLVTSLTDPVVEPDTGWVQVSPAIYRKAMS